MATELEPTTTTPAERYQPLARLRGYIRTYVVLEALTALGLFLAAWFWLGLLLDYGVFRLTALRPWVEGGFPVLDWVDVLPRGVRALILVVLLATLGVILVRSLALRLFREFRPEALALLLERRFPKVLGDRLITAVELSDPAKAERLGYSRQLVDATIREADERLAGLPVQQVFDWRRLKVRGWWLLALVIVPLLLVAGVHVIAHRSVEPKQFAYDCKHTAEIWAERNLLLRDSRWPRRAQLEVVSPAEPELRIGRDAKAPRVEVRALKWVVADNNAPTGWRALTWADLHDQKDLLGSQVPALPVAVFAEAANLPQGARPAEADWPVDLVEALLQREELQMDGRIRAAVPGEEGTRLAERIRSVVEAELVDRTAEPSMNRRLRQLVVPESVTLHYQGEQTANKAPLRGSGAEYAGDLADLKESVRYSVRALDFATPERAITLVPPPMLTALACDEDRPAYLYHRPPPDGGAAALKPLRHHFPQQRLSLDGPVSRHVVPAGTEAVLTGETDKELAAVTLRPRPGKGNADALPPTILDADRRHFRAPFPPLTRAVEFEIEMVDVDGVVSRRPVVIEAATDRTPDVEVQVEGLRKAEGGFLVTPIAEIPFIGRVLDDHGLEKVEYEASYESLDAPKVAASRAALTAGLLFLPTTPGGPAPVPAYAPLLARPEPRTEVPPAPLGSFALLAADRAARAPRLEELRRLLNEPPGESLLIRQFEVRPERERFDLRDRVPGLQASSAVAPEYRLRLTVRATDTNVLIGPRVGRNKETFTFLVVSETYLRREIAKEEEQLKTKIRKVLEQLQGSRSRLEEMTARFGQLNPSAPKEEFELAGSRTQTIEETVARGRDLTAEVLADYTRILRELQLNRVADNVIKTVEQGVVGELDAAVRTNFPNTEAAQKKLRTALDAKQAPTKADADTAQRELIDLIDRLQRVLLVMGEMADLRELVAAATRIRDTLRESGVTLEAIKKALGEDILSGITAPPKLAAAEVTVASGQKATVSVLLDKAALKTISLELSAPADSELQVPKTVTVEKGATKASFDVTAGSKTGEFAIRVKPADGTPIEVKVTVK